MSIRNRAVGFLLRQGTMTRTHIAKETGTPPFVVMQIERVQDKNMKTRAKWNSFKDTGRLI